ncbi:MULTISPECIES: hypothetical protein [Burkholderia cepacia complex]|uniref:hypothetical protein n=1 Tax=Burkholderia cepacia complex TaxID=87882 RepID=UPI000B10C806|nr:MULTISPECIES: hypothetical protein [Burkholderia cepacia complex]QTO46336.1 hypothetical protein J8I85_17990 [Burkholderia latens]
MAIKDGGNMKEATECVHHARTGKAGTYKAEPPKGPKPEPVRTNGIKAPKERGVSK